MTSTTGRVYGGLTAEERAAQRRERLVEAGIEVVGTVGYSATTQQALCRASGVAERYFYESFPDLLALLEAVYVQVCSDVATEVLAALATAGDDLESQAQVGMRTFVDATLRDPRRARIQLLEAVGVDPRVERVRRDVIEGFAQIVAEQVRPYAGPGGLDPDLVGMSVAGAVNEVLIDVVLDRRSPDREALVAHCVGVTLALGRAVQAAPAASTDGERTR